ncbi:HEAT repeat domain-containing protein [Candidatus Avelusimicrobium facis]|uniref:HEAT repeat domain-containing protein n=1 Tax=Candidatus Avelusimicrobium facis TaxID=3416203 RepID=UPI003D134C34
MKKCSLWCAFAALGLAGSLYAAAPSDELSAVMPLLQAKTRNAAQNQQVLDLFARSKKPALTFAAGASLVRLPPHRVQEAKLLNLLIKDSDPLKKVFSAVVLTAMGTVHTELSPLLQDATASQDHAVRAYAASAYTILNPQTADYADEVINLYIYDPAFAQRAMNLISSGDKQTLKYLRAAARNPDGQVRAAAAAWLGDLQNKDAAKQLLKMAKTEQDSQAETALASALAKNREWTMDDCLKGLKTATDKPAASTYALALGFMTGHAVEALKQALSDKSADVRANAARAAAYMAGVLSSPQRTLYTSDPAFDSALLKTLIPHLTALEKTDTAAVKPYAANALQQMAKLK